jgi:hypothetical protein
VRGKGTAGPQHEWAPPDARIDACAEHARCVAFPRTRASQHVSRTCGKDACPPRPASRRPPADRLTWSRRRAGTRHLSTRQACAASDREDKDHAHACARARAAQSTNSAADAAAFSSCSQYKEKHTEQRAWRGVPSAMKARTEIVDALGRRLSLSSCPGRVALPGTFGPHSCVPGSTPLPRLTVVDGRVRAMPVPTLIRRSDPNQKNLMKFVKFTVRAFLRTLVPQRQCLGRLFRKSRQCLGRIMQTTRRWA